MKIAIDQALMKSVDKTESCILPSGTCAFKFKCRRFEYVNTPFVRLLSQDSEDQPIMSPCYSVIMLRVRQNEHDRAFVMLAARPI